MNYSFRPIRKLKQQPLLTYVSKGALAAEPTSNRPQGPDYNVRRLIRLWEERAAPYTCVRTLDESEHSHDFARADLFRAGDLVFDSVRCSILRNPKFKRFYEDIGTPPIIMIGGRLESTIIATSLDAYWSNIHLTVVRDAVLASYNWSDRECVTLFKAISNFVDVVDTEFFAND